MRDDQDDDRGSPAGVTPASHLLVGAWAGGVASLTCRADRREDLADRDRFRSRVRSPRPEDVTDLRHTVADWLTLRATPRRQVRRVLLVLSELATNAVRSAESHLEVGAAVHADGASVLVVHDDGPGFDLDRALARRGAGGIGLRLVERLTDDLHVASGPPGTVTWALLRPGR